MDFSKIWKLKALRNLIKFVYSEKAAKFCEISNLLLSTVHTDKSKLEILQNFAAFSEYMNFTSVRLDWGNLQNLNKAAVNSFLLPTHHTIAAQFMCVEATQIAGSILLGRQKLGAIANLDFVGKIFRTCFTKRTFIACHKNDF